MQDEQLDKTAVLAAFCDVATNSNPGLTAFRQDIDGLNLFISISPSIPNEVGVEERYRSMLEHIISLVAAAT